jgi:ankyrin repeat protein
VELLLEAGAPAFAVDGQGRAPLHFAAYAFYGVLFLPVVTASVLSYNGQEDCVRLLLEKGALPDVADQDRRTPLHNASYSGDLDLVNLLCSLSSPFPLDKQGRLPLHYAAVGGHSQLVVALGKLKDPTSGTSHINDRDADGATALHLAIR